MNTAATQSAIETATNEQIAHIRARLPQIAAMFDRPATRDDLVNTDIFVCSVYPSPAFPEFWLTEEQIASAFA